LKWKYFLETWVLIPMFGIFVLISAAFGSMTGDIDNYQGTDLRDAVAAIQVCAGMNPSLKPGIDEKIGLQHAIFALQVAAGIRKILFVSEGDEPVSIDLSLTEPSAANSSLETLLPDGQGATLIKSDIITRKENDYTWLGKIGGQEDSTVVMSVVEGAMFGYISSETGSYFIQPEGDGYRVVKNAPALLAPHGEDAIVPDSEYLKKALRQQHVTRDTEDGSSIEVLVLYTVQMQTKYGSSLNSLIQHFVDLTNQAYINSGISTQLRLAHTELYNNSAAQEGTDTLTALYHIKDSAGVKASRDLYKADMISLLRVYSGTGDYCGMGFVMTSDWLGPQFEGLAFSVIEVRPVNEANPYYCSELTFAHELGHNMGCAHDRDNAKVAGAYNYSYGYDSSGIFATIMSYDEPEIPYFSTPRVTYSGIPIGKDVDKPDSAYNALTINNTKAIVANFRFNTTTTTVKPTTTTSTSTTTTSTTVKPTTTSTSTTTTSTTVKPETTTTSTSTTTTSSTSTSTTSSTTTTTVPSDCLLLQNQTVTGTKYETAGCIRAGSAYIVESGADVTMEAGTIYMEPGFEARGGSKFRATAK